MKFAFHFFVSLVVPFLSLALEGVLLIRAVSPATPQGSVSQPDTQKQSYTLRKSSLVYQILTHMHTLII